MDTTPTGAGASSGARVHPRGALRALLTELDTRRVHATPRAVAVALWTFSDRHGGAWPSQRRLARLTGRCERTVRSAVKALEASGVIVRDVPALPLRRARRATTLYRLLAGDAPPVAPPTPPPPLPMPPLLAATIDRCARLTADAADAPDVAILPAVELALDRAELDGHEPAGHQLDGHEPVAPAGPHEPREGDHEHRAGHHAPHDGPQAPAEGHHEPVAPDGHHAPADGHQAHARPTAPPRLAAALARVAAALVADAPFTGNPCRTREPSPTDTFRLAREAPPGRSTPRAAPAPRPPPRPRGTPQREPLAALIARCAALARQRPT